MKPVEGYVDAKGVQIYFKALGAGSPLVILHGGPGCDHRDFLPYLLPLARHYRLIFIDERGSGRSGRLPNTKGYTLENMADDVECVRKSLGLQRIALMGHSFGGIVAQAYAIRYPGKLVHLVLAGTGSSAKRFNADFRQIRSVLSLRDRRAMTAHEKRGIFGQDGRYRAGYMRFCLRALGPYMYARGIPKVGWDYGISGWEVLREMWVRRSDFHVDGNLRGLDLTQRLRIVNVPTLIVIGDHDIVSTASARATARALPRSRIEVMAECGHMMFVDDSRGFNSLVGQFLRQRRSPTRVDK